MMRRRRTGVAILLASFVAISACSQVRNPATGELQYTSLDREEEAALGAQEHERVLAQFGGVYQDPELEAYVRRIGNELQQVSELPEEQFTFTVLNSAVVNAFALPGGYVYVSRGLLALAENEAELAGVIGHEIGHVTARHSAQQYDRQQIGQVATGVFGAIGALGGALIGGEDGARLGSQLFGGGAGAISGGVIASYSRDQEFQADELGVRYLARAGYEPEAMSTFLRALSANDELSRKLAGSNTSLANSWFSTHPRTADRVEKAAREASVTNSNATRVDRNLLLDRIHGMIWGEGPSQGYTIGQRFAHPELRFEFEVPRGFSLSNQPTMVLARRDDTVIVFDLEQSELSPERYIRDGWIDGAPLEGLRSFSTDQGYDAASAETSVRLRGGTAKALLIAIEGPGKTMYRFMTVSQQIGRAVESEALATADSFKILSPAEAAKLKPQRIKVVEFMPGQTIEDFVGQMDVDRFPKEHFMTLNGLDRGHELSAGDRIKIIVRE